MRDARRSGGYGRAVAARALEIVLAAVAVFVIGHLVFPALFLVFRPTEGQCAWVFAVPAFLLAWFPVAIAVLLSRGRPGRGAAVAGVRARDGPYWDGRRALGGLG